MNIVIIGNGISGSTAARYVRELSDFNITMISDESPYPFSRTALMYIYMGHMKFEHTKLYSDQYWTSKNIHTIQGKVSHIDVATKSLTLGDGRTINYDKLVIASGSKPNKFGWPGQDLKGVQGLYHLQDLESMENATAQGIKKAVIVGGGLIGIEMAEMFLSRGIPVTFLVREQSFWDIVLPPEESSMINRHILDHHIDLRLSEEILEIKGVDGKVKSLVCKNSGEEIPCDFVGLTVGVSPNIDFVKSSTIQTNRGIVVNDYLQTSDPNVFACGDCAELSNPSTGRRPIEAVWYTGKMMGETIAKNVCNVPTKYYPGLWYNSAKFLDIEYQVYGNVPAILPEDTISLFWQHPKENKSIRINYKKDSNIVTGFNLMGIRYRHHVCEKWILDQTPIDVVLENLSLANFDVEFSDQYEQNVIDKYNLLYNTQVRLKSKRSLSLVQKWIKL